MKQVSRKEFETFIKNYPRKLEKNLFMDWLDYYDFPSDDYQPKDLDDLYSHKVARYYNSYGETSYYIKEENDMKLEEICKLIKPIESECPPPSEEMIFMESDDNVARCHKIEPFDVFEICDRETAFEEAKKLQDSGQDVSVIFASDGRIYMQFLTKNNLFLYI